MVVNLILKYLLMQVLCYIHADHTSRIGIVAMLAGAAVGDWLGKHKLVSKSSSETEVIGLLDRLPHIL